MATVVDVSRYLGVVRAINGYVRAGLTPAEPVIRLALIAHEDPRPALRRAARTQAARFGVGAMLAAALAAAADAGGSR